MNVPVIKLEVEGMRHTILTALTQHSAEMDQYIREAVERYCEPENIRSVVLTVAAREIDCAVRSSIEHFFRFGEGRAAVMEAVREGLRGDDAEV